MKKRTVDVADVPVIMPGEPLKKRVSNTQNARMILLSEHWNSLSNDLRMQWNEINGHMQDPANPKNNGAKGPTGYTAFFACNSSLLTASQPIQHAPSTYAPPQPLPPIRVDITFAGVGQTPSINLVPQIATPYPAGPKIVLWATKAYPLGNGVAQVFRARDYYKIGVISGGLPTAGVNVVSEYLSVFPSVPSSSKIGFQLMAVADGGYHTSKLHTFGLTPLLSMAAAKKQDDDTDLHLPASGE